MKFLFVIFLFKVLTNTTYAQTTFINIPSPYWYERLSFEEALQKAAKENKMLYIDLHCAKCYDETNDCAGFLNQRLFLFKKILIDKEVANVYQKKFISVEYNVETKEGEALFNRYGFNVRGIIPCNSLFLFLSSSGELLHWKVDLYSYIKNSKGNLEIDSSGLKKIFIQLAYDALDSSRQKRTFINRWKQGYRDTALVNALANSADFSYNYLSLLDKKEIDELEDLYFELIKPKLNNSMELEQEQQLTAYSNFHSSKFQDMLYNRSKYYPRYGKQRVKSFIDEVCISEVIKIAEDSILDKEKRYNIVRQKIQKARLDSSDYFLFAYDLAFLFYSKQWKRYANLTLSPRGQQMLKNVNALMYATIAYVFVNYIDDIKQLNQALVYSKKAIAIEERDVYYDVHACLLYKAGNKQEAIVAGEKALELATKNKSKELDKIRTNLSLFKKE